MKHPQSLKRKFLCKVKHIAEGEARAYRKFAEWEHRRKEAEDRGEEFTDPPPTQPQEKSQEKTKE